MMKKFYTLFIFLASAINVYAQQRDIDSLKKLLQTAKEDTNKVNILIKFGRYYTTTSPDSAMLTNQQLLHLSRKLNYLKGEANGLNLMGVVYQTKGNYPKALSYLLAALKINEKRNSRMDIAKNLGNIGNTYAAEGDHRKSIVYMLKSKAILEEIRNEEVLKIALTNLGNEYQILNILDSGRIFTQQAYELGIKYKDTVTLGYTTDNLGNIYAKMKNQHIALDYYRSALFYFKQVVNDEALSNTMLSMAELFKGAGQADSSLYYARRAYAMAKHGGFTPSIMDAGQFLNAYFKSMGKLDSAYHYLEVSVAAKDSLFSQEKVKELQNLSFAEQQRQREMAEQARLDLETRNKNLQMGGIAVFLLAFFLIVLYLSRLHIPARTIDFLGVVVLLLTFEFLVMAIGPLIALLIAHTSNAPVMILMIRVCLATAITPIYQRTERWVKHKLSYNRAKAEN